MTSALFFLFRTVEALTGDFWRTSPGLCLPLIFLGLRSEKGPPWPHTLQGPS